MNPLKVPIDHIGVYPGGSNLPILIKNDPKYWCFDNNSQISTIK